MTVWTVTADQSDSRRGRLTGAGVDIPCALGRSGTIAAKDKAEGDGCTPIGTYPFRQIFYRADKVAKPQSVLPCRAITKTDGWCDAADHAAYNQLVNLPFDASHEVLWREDDIYDIILVIGHNDDPVEVGKGSAIFIHVAREGCTPTEGCVAFEQNDLLRLLATIRSDDLLELQETFKV